MTLMLGPGRPLDAGALGGILHGFATGTDWMPVLHSEAEAIGFCGRMIDAGWVRVARRKARVLGFIACEGTIIHALYVAHDARGQGVGRALLDEAKAGMRALELWTFQANTGAQRFYRQAGFTEICRTDGAENDEGLPDIKYGWHVQGEGKSSS